MSDGHERLRRLLFLVPYVAKHPGIPVEELARQLEVKKESLLEDLDLLTLVGRPPFQPDDCIDIYVENGKVFVALDARLTAPPRLTASEAAALAAAADSFQPAAASALARAKEKLTRVMPPSATQQFAEMERKIDAAIEAPPTLAPLAEAITQRQEVTFDYFALHRGQTEQRRVRPRELVAWQGHWYLFGFCLSRQATRSFRLDRVQGLSRTDTRFELSTGALPELPIPQGVRGEVRVRFSSKVASYVRERFGGSAHPLADGGAEVLVRADSERWLTQWILSFAGEAQVLDPAWARQAVAHAAQASLES